MTVAIGARTVVTVTVAIGARTVVTVIVVLGAYCSYCGSGDRGSLL